MPGFSVSPTAVVNQIKSNLQDRYESGYPILKELLQNADDARARRFRLDALSGWPDAYNPLLRGPGLLAINDGRFNRDDRCGILAFGESPKAADRAAIGKFGLGQKAVFHLCDAFVVHAVGFDAPFTRVVNPFLGVEVDGNVTDRWDSVNERDAALLSRATEYFGQRALLLWLPFRRHDLTPAPDAGFSNLRPRLGTLARELARTNDLRLLLTALRHLESVEIQHQGSKLCSVRVRDTQGRLGGLHDQPPSKRSFGGTIDNGSDCSRRFVGREATTRDEHLERLRSSEYWPKTISARSSKPGREKGEQHGAVTLLRSGNNNGQPGELTISWAVFLPVSEAESTVLCIENGALGRIHLLLHGYFFLDSGRRHIEGLGEPASSDDPADEASLRRAWNTRLRDTAVLPLVPAILKDAFDHGIMTAQELAYLTAAVTDSSWYKTNRTAICKETALVRVLAGPEVGPAERVMWELVPADAKLRSLPATLADGPELAEMLLGGLHGWAERRELKLCIDRSASLTSQSMNWSPEELGSLLQSLSEQAFLSRSLAALLGGWLSEAVLNEDARTEVAPHLMRALRQAMLGTKRLAPSNHISNVLQHVPRDQLFALRSDVPRAVLSALSNTNATILPVRSKWLQPGGHQSPPSEADLNAFLLALAPLVQSGAGNLADQASAVAIALLSGHQLSELANQQQFMPIRVLRARDPDQECIVVLTIAEFCARARQRLLFRRAPNVESRLHTVARALRDLRPLVVEAPTDGGIHELTDTINKQVLSTLIKTTSGFGPPADRARLIELLSILEGADDFDALRRLCAGDRNAGGPDAKLWNGAAFPELERIIASMLEQRRTEFLVPARIMAELNGTKQRELAIRDLDTAALERLIGEGIDTLRRQPPSESERNALLKAGLEHDLLRRLPIHDRSNGTVGSAECAFREDGRWAIPDRFRDWVITVRVFSEPDLRSIHEALIPVWSPQAQIEVALSQDEPHRYVKEILDAISELPLDDTATRTALIDSLRTKPWLTANNTAVAPKDLLTLPREVDKTAEPHFAGSSRYISVGHLPEPIRTHPGFCFVQENLMPDRRSSLAGLATMLADVGLPGRLGAAEDLPIDHLAALARVGADLKLPGWPLLASMLLSITDDPDSVRKVAGSLREISHTQPEIAGRYLHALAVFADRQPANLQAAEHVYRLGFEAVAKWNMDAREHVFRHTLVPTKNGRWRCGREVVVQDTGVVADHVLAREYASSLSELHDAVGIRVADSSVGRVDEQLSIDELRAKSVNQHREFLEHWRGRIPDSLVAVYLHVVGRHNPQLYEYCTEWPRDPTVDRDLDTLTCHVPALFLIELVRAPAVEVLALSGDRFRAPLDANASLAIDVQSKFKIWPGEERRTKVVTLKVRTTAYDQQSLGDRVQDFRKFVATAVTECLSADVKSALIRIVDRVAHVDQTTLEDTTHLLLDRLPALLAALKLPARSNALHALRRYEAAEIRASDEMRVKLKQELWRSICAVDVAREVLTAVRERIEDQGYGLHRVLFELFQNADDAYVQQESETLGACFHVDFGSTDHRRLRLVHWGRPINHPGLDVEVGRSRGYDRDLLNMLVMNFSEKRPEGNVTGKFGLGFKCVHLLSDSVGVASGFVAVRTVGGILPEPWPDGLRLVDEFSRSSGERATVIDVPFNTDEMAIGAKRTEQAFRGAMPWLPALARRIGRIDVLGCAPATISCKVSRLSRDYRLSVVSITGTRQIQQALRFDLGDDYTLLLKVGTEGPECFEPSVARVWNLAPLEESLRSGWLLNGPFPVDPGRGRLAGSIEDRQAQFVTLGKALGERLLSLHDIVERDWEELAHALDLNIADNDGRSRFWSCLFDVMSLDLDDALARRLHAIGRGYGLLAAERPVVPTRLPVPFDPLVCASSIQRVTDGALATTSVLQATRQWNSSGQLVGRVVGPEVAIRMRRLGFDQIQAISLSELLRMEMGEDKRVDVNLGTRLGQVITPDDVENEPLLQERQGILDIAKQAKFLAQDGAWRPVRALSSRFRNDEEETLLCRFAPDTVLLHEDYTVESLKFFEVARRQSGYGPVPALLREWVDAAHDEDRQRAALRYLVHGRQGRALAKLVRDRPPTWMADIPAQFLTHRLLEFWTDEERKQLALEFDPAQVKVDPPPPPPPPPREVSSILNKVHQWWMEQRQHELPRYERSVYPGEFCAAGLAGVDGGIDRTAWFTMFALACFRSFGRPQDETHRNFIHFGWQEGWWADLAQSEPPGGVQPWLTRLNRWSAPDRFDETYHQWQRTLVDLYTIARGMNVYVELIRKFPAFVEKHGPASIEFILRPGESALAQQLGMDAAPISRALGIGANWLIRELSRKELYDSDEARLMARYCWAPTQRVRLFLTALDPDLYLTADKDVSPRIYNFVTCHVGVECASFDGDFDLPLQIVTRERHRGLLKQWFEEEGLDAPEFGNDSEHGEDYG